MAILLGVVAPARCPPRPARGLSHVQRVCWIHRAEHTSHPKCRAVHVRRSERTFYPLVRPHSTARPRLRPRFVPTQTTARPKTPPMWYCPRFGVANEKTPPARGRVFSSKLIQNAVYHVHPRCREGRTSAPESSPGTKSNPPAIGRTQFVPCSGLSTPLEGVSTQPSSEDES